MNKEQLRILRLKCSAKGFNFTDLPEKIGVSRATFYRKIKNNSFTILDVKAIKQTLNLADRDVKSIFFDNYVS